VLAPSAASAQAVDQPTKAKDSPNPVSPDTTHSTTLDEVVVTAQKRGENLQAVPIAISAYTATDLAASNVEGISDLTNITPSLEYTYQGGAQAPFLRGVGSLSGFPGSEAEVQTYIDGVYYAAQIQGLMKFNNITSVEVDKGPQGTLFGRNATGGIIQITTRTPSPQTAAALSVGYGNHNLRDADFYGTTGVAPELAADLAVHYEAQDGWGSNIYNGHDTYASFDVGVRSKWLWTPSDVTRLTLIFDYGRDKSGLGTTFARADGTTYLPPDGTLPTGPLGYYTVNLDRDSYTVNQQWGASFKVQSQLGALPLVSISSYRGNHSSAVTDADFTPYNYVNGLTIQKETTLTQELQLLSPSSSKRLQWILGAFFYYDEGQDDPLRIVGDVTGPALRVDNYSSMVTHSYAGYGQATYNITETTHLTGGVRNTQDYRAQNGLVLFVFPAPNPPAVLPGGNLYPKAQFNAWTGKVSLAQDFTDHVMGYVSYNHGFKSGIFNTYLIFSNPAPAVNPEYIDAYEAGLKTELFDRRLRLNGSMFYYDYSQLQVQSYSRLGGVALGNAASAHITGGEVEFDTKLAQRTTLHGGISVVDARFGGYPDAPEYLPVPITQPNTLNGGFGGMSLSSTSAAGHQMPYSPKTSLDMSFDQGIPIGSGELSLTAALKYQSKVYFTPDNLYSQSGYALLSSSLKWTSSSGNWDVTVWGRNLTDRRAWVLKALTGFGSAALPLEPRTFGIRFGYRSS
jgi:iron complex outermembrane recepter protein